jgi:hypothetical protein
VPFEALDVAAALFDDVPSLLEEKAGVQDVLRGEEFMPRVFASV